MTLSLNTGFRVASHIRWRWSPTGAFHYTILVLVGLAAITPLAFLILGSFSVATIPGDISLSHLTFAHYADAWLDDHVSLFANTLIYVCGATVLGLAIAAALAWFVERTDMPCKTLVYAGVPMTLAVPGMLQAMAWILLLSPRIGFLNQALKDLLGLDAMPFNIYSLTGMVFVEGMRLVPTAFLMLVPLLRGMDPSLEEAAAICGARPVRSFRRVALALMKPGLVAVLIFQAMTALEVFEVPGVLGLPARIYVFSTKIYSVVNSAGGSPAYGEADALAILYLVVALAAGALYMRVIARSERYSIVTGKGYRPRLYPLGRWRYAVLSLVFAFLLLSVVAPFLVFLYISLLRVLQMPSAAAFSSMSFINYRGLLDNDLIGTTLANTILMVMTAATATTVLSFLVSMVIVRSRFWARKILDNLAFLPHAIPGMVMGLAMLTIFLKLDQVGLPIFGTIWSIAIAFTIGFLSYGTRALNASILQIHKDLEEAAMTSGAPQWRVMWRVFLPLLLPSLVGVWVWSMLHAVRIAGTPLILYEGQDNQVLAVMIWNMWDEGYIPAVGAIGTLLMATLLLLTVGLRVVGFGRNSALGEKIQ